MLGLPRPGTAFDHDGSSASSAHLLEPVFDDRQLFLAASNGKGLRGHVTFRTRPDSVLATSSKGSLLR
jgi:hypothetical protein